MFEEELKKISREIFKDKHLSEYFILTHKKHFREIYIKTSSNNALDFVKPKFNSVKKNIILMALRLKLLQPFLKKIKLSGEIGDVVLIGEQIKGIDLKRRTVNSFLHIPRTREKFISSKKDQSKLGKLGFAPKIIKLVESQNYSQEELMDHYNGRIDKLFERLLEFYRSDSFKKINYINLKNKLRPEKNNKELFETALDRIKKVDYFLYGKIHGEFAKEQCLTKNGKIYFVDWDMRRGLITEDIVNFFRGEEDFLNNKEFMRMIKKYPSHVNDNLREYLIATELLRIHNKISRTDLSEKRLSNLLKMS